MLVDKFTRIDNIQGVGKYTILENVSVAMDGVDYK